MTLTQNETASSVYVGFSGASEGTLDLGSNTLSVTNFLYLGYLAGATGTIQRTSGSFAVGGLSVDNGNSFTFDALDTAGALHVSHSSAVTTGATGNVTTSVNVFSAGTLTLGADLNLSNTLDVRDNSVLDMGGHAVNAQSIFLGYYDGLPTTLQNRGAFTAQNLYVGNESLNLIAADSLTSLNVTSAAHVTTAATSNVTSTANVFTGGTLTLGADLNIANNLDVRDNSVVDMAGHTISANAILLGYFDGSPTTLQNRAALTATYLEVGNQAFDLDAVDSVQNYLLHAATSTLNSPVSFLHLEQNAHATTTAAGSVSARVEVFTGGTLTLGDNMTLTGNIDVRDNSVLDMAGHTISANTLFLGWYDGLPTSLSNRAALTATRLYVGNQAFDLDAVDTVQNFYLHAATGTLNSAVSFLHLEQNAQGTTTAAGNVSGGAEVFGGGTLTLGADMTLTGNIDVRDNSVLDMAGHAVNAQSIFLGYYDGLPTTLQNRGAFTAQNLYVGNESLNLIAADSLAIVSVTSAAHVTTAATSNVTSTANVFTGGTLTLGAGMTLTGNIDVRDNSVVDMAGHPLSANTVFLGWYDGLPTSLSNRAALTATYLYVGNQSFNLNAADSASNLSLHNASATTTAVGNVTASVNVDSASILTLGAGMALAGNASIDSGGLLDLRGHNATIGGLHGGGIVDNLNPSTTSVLTVGANNASSVFSGTIQNSGSLAMLSLTKIGAGAVTLSGANTYTGVTTVQGGTLQLNGTVAQNPVLNVGGADVQNDWSRLVFDYTGGSTPAAAHLEHAHRQLQRRDHPVGSEQPQ